MLATQTKAIRAPTRSSPGFIPFVIAPADAPSPLKLRQDVPPIGSTRSLPDEVYVTVHRQNLHPLVAAGRLGVSPSTVMKRQALLGLEPHLYAPGQRGPKVSDIQLRRANAEALSTGEAAVKLVLSPCRVLKRWRGLGLEPKRDRRVKASDKQMIKAYADGLTTADAGKRLGVDHSTVSKSWAFFDLPIDGLEGQITDDMVCDAYRKKFSAKFAGGLLGIKPEIVMRRWNLAHRKPKGPTRMAESALMDARQRKPKEIDGVPGGLEAARRVSRLKTDVTEEQLRDVYQRKLTTTAAADELGVSQPTISRGWRDLRLKPHSNAGRPKKRLRK